MRRQNRFIRLRECLDRIEAHLEQPNGHYSGLIIVLAQRWQPIDQESEYNCDQCRRCSFFDEETLAYMEKIRTFHGKLEEELDLVSPNLLEDMYIDFTKNPCKPIHGLIDITVICIEERHRAHAAFEYPKDERAINCRSVTLLECN